MNMEKRHKEAIRKCYTQLREDLDVTYVLGYLFEQALFEHHHAEIVEKEETEENQRERLLRILITRGPDAYPAFITCLQKCKGQRHLADLLISKDGDADDSDDQSQRKSTNQFSQPAIQFKKMTLEERPGPRGRRVDERKEVSRKYDKAAAIAGEKSRLEKSTGASGMPRRNPKKPAIEVDIGFESDNPTNMKAAQTKEDRAAARKRPTRVSTSTSVRWKPAFQRPVTGMVCHKGFLFVVHACHNMLYVFNETALVTSYKVPKMNDPCDMDVVHTDGCKLVIVDWGTRSLHWIRVNMQNKDCKLTFIFSQTLVYKPWGIISDNKSQKVVVGEDTGHRLFVYNFQGDSQYPVPLPSGMAPESLVSTDSGYVVCDATTGKLARIEEDGSLLQFIKPNDIGSRMCVYLIKDSDNRLLVADMEGDSVILLTDEGDYMCHILRQHNRIQQPTRLALDSQHGKLYVGHNASYQEEQTEPEIVLVYDYESLVSDAIAD